MDIQPLVEAIRNDPEMSEHVSEIVTELEQQGVTPEMLEAMGQAIGQALDNPESYQAIREQALVQGMIDEDDFPPQFDEMYLVAILLALNEVKAHLSSRPQFAKGGLAQLARKGRGGDTMLAHINGAEAEALRRMGGSGAINPATGIHEFKGGFFKKIGKGLKKIVKPVLTVASVIPGPWQVPALALNTAYNASQGNWLGAVASAFGAYGAGGGFGGAAPGFSGGDLGSGISGSIGGASGLANAGVAGLANAAPAMESLGSLGSGISGGLSSASNAAGALTGAGELATGGLSFGGLGEVAPPAMESLGGLGDGITGSIEGTQAPLIDPDTMQTLKTAKNVAGLGRTAYNMLNPPEPEQFSQQNTQRQMQQMGGLGMNTNRTFGLGGTQSRGIGQMARFRNGGLARYSCGGK